jgi:hypothetical protein
METRKSESDVVQYSRRHQSLLSFKCLCSSDSFSQYLRLAQQCRVEDQCLMRYYAVSVDSYRRFGGR